MERLRLTVLGATGSIGTSTLDLVDASPERFEIIALTGHDNVDRLAELARKHRPKLVVISDPSKYRLLQERLGGLDVDVAAGDQGLSEAARRPVDCLIGAIVGVAGLKPTLAALEQGVRLGLANKECLVTAGDVFMRRVTETGTTLVPVDSEHSAVFQAVGGCDLATVERITITASGGPFRTWERERLARATVEDALKHPNWSMGRKITIDSATLFNKGLELIEAHHLFPVGHERLDAVVHPQSIVHALVSFVDGSVRAELAHPDMRMPIALALAHPERMTTATRRLDLANLGPLTFEPVDTSRFPALALARAAMRRGGTAPAVLNAANEVAVAQFLDRRIGFLDIAHRVADCMEAAESRGYVRAAAGLDDVLEADRGAREFMQAFVRPIG